MKTRAAILWTIGAARPYADSRPLTVEEVDIDGPGPGEVLLAIRAAGLCHSDLSAIDGVRPRERTPLPICIGFGISTPEHVRHLAPVADGLIVGSAVVRRIAEAATKPREVVLKDVGEYVATLIKALG